ncbi:MAG: adenosine deaminase [Anaerolineales bacterium]|jgi:adenosine deaminase
MKEPIPSDKSMKSWYERVPKVELHLHLEGAIPYEVLWELVRKYGGDLQVPDQAALLRKFEYKDFPHFIETWIWMIQFLREYEDFTLMAEAVARDLASQNIRYAEAFNSPPDFVLRGLQLQRLTEAIRAGLRRVPEVEIALIADVVRDLGTENAAVTLAQISEVRDLGVIGIGLGGSEQRFPPEPFEKVYEQARRLGMHTTAHAGEAAGPESLWGAIHTLQVERIGHGVRAIEDEKLLAYLADTRLPLELCPLSNVRTGVVKSIDEHPARKLFERGLFITINSDDPKMFGNSLAEEYRVLEERLGFSRPELRSLILNAISAAWLPPERKLVMQTQFCAEPAWQEN